MFKGFIVMGVAFSAGYLKGYFKGQQVTKEVGATIKDLRDDPKTQEFLQELLTYLKQVNVEVDVNETEETVDIPVDDENGSIPNRITEGEES